MIAVGQRFGRLLIVRQVVGKRYDQWRWLCRCDCGKEMTLRGSALRGGRNKSCGCFRRDRAGGLYRTHGKSKTVAYCMFYDARKRAQALGIPCTIRPEEIVIPERCPVLGFVLEAKGHRDRRPSLDRVVPSLGYVPGNIHVISFRANRIKSDSSPTELRAVLAYSERR